MAAALMRALEEDHDYRDFVNCLTIGRHRASGTKGEARLVEEICEEVIEFERRTSLLNKLPINEAAMHMGVSRGVAMGGARGAPMGGDRRRIATVAAGQGRPWVDRNQEQQQQDRQEENWPKFKCHNCGGMGHIKAVCPSPLFPQRNAAAGSSGQKPGAVVF